MREKSNERNYIGSLLGLVECSKVCHQEPCNSDDQNIVCFQSESMFCTALETRYEKNPIHLEGTTK